MAKPTLKTQSRKIPRKVIPIACKDGNVWGVKRSYLLKVFTEKPMNVTVEDGHGLKTRTLVPLSKINGWIYAVFNCKTYKF